MPNRSTPRPYLPRLAAGFLCLVVAHPSSAAVPPSRTKLHFSHACEGGQRISILAVGDVLLHGPLAAQGLRSATGFRSLWAPLSDEIAAADVAYANLEGPAAGNLAAGGRIVRDPGRHYDRVAYTSYPQFNYSSDLPRDLKESGFDVVSTANNHALDRGSLGIDRTIAALRDAGLPFTGTLVSSERENAVRTAFTEAKGMKLAWIACSYGTNGITDTRRQVLGCYADRAILLAEIRRQKSDPAVAAVIVTPHWGTEYQTSPGPEQTKLAHEMIEAGALVILGGHPHVLQPVDKITASDGHEGFVIYSLGNFISGQTFSLGTKTAAVLYIGLTRVASGEVVVNGVRHLPTAMVFSGEISVHPAAGSSEPSRAYANAVLGGSTEIQVGEPLVTNVECAR